MHLPSQPPVIVRPAPVFGEVVFFLSADKLILQAAEQLSGQGLTVYAVVFGFLGMCCKARISRYTKSSYHRKRCVL